MEQEKNFLVKQSEIQKILDYLAKRPYIEVNQLIQIFFNLQEGIEKPDKSDKKNNK